MDENIDYVMAMNNYMLKYDLNQNELAKRLKVTPAAVGKWINANNGITPRNREKIRRLCHDCFCENIPGNTEDQKDITKHVINELLSSALEDKGKEPPKIICDYDNILSIIVKGWDGISTDSQFAVLRCFLNQQKNNQ